MSVNYTSSGSKTVAVSGVKRMLIQVNAALTGTIAIADSTATKATITNPTVGSQFIYFDLVGTVTVNPSTTCDITVNTTSSNQL